MLRDVCTNEIQQIERKIAMNTFYYIPKKRVRALEATIQHGTSLPSPQIKRDLIIAMLVLRIKRMEQVVPDARFYNWKKKVVISHHTL